MGCKKIFMMNLFENNKTGYKAGRGARDFRRIVAQVQRISLIVILWLLFIMLLYGSYVIVFVKPYFKVNKIAVSTEHGVLSQSAVIEMAGIKEGDPILAVSVDEIKKRLLANPRIEKVVVHRKLPGTIWIYVKEYVPVAIIRLDGFYYVDERGNIFKKVDGNDRRDYPIITGFEDNANPTTAQEKAKDELLEALQVIRVYERSYIGEVYGISELNYNPDRGFSVITLKEPMEIRLGFDSYREKLLDLQTVYPAVRLEGGRVLYVDFGTRGKVVVKHGA
jgi:cell division protein FtsQ